MTLGGLALAIGMLVDDATVEVENIHRNRHAGKAADAWRSSTAPQQIAVPGARGHADHLHRLLPGGAARRAGALPVHAAGARGGASRCWRRTCCRARWCRRWRACCWSSEAHARRGRSRASVGRFNAWRDAALRALPGGATAAPLGRACCTTARFVLIVAALAGGGLHLGAAVRRGGSTSSPRSTPARCGCTSARPIGTRIEETEQLVGARRAAHPRASSPPTSSTTINDNIGMPDLLQPGLRARPTTSAARTPRSSSRSSRDHQPTARVHAPHPRASCPTSSPAPALYFQPADIVSQVLNFGLSAPIDVQVDGADLRAELRARARSCATASRAIPGTADVRIAQVLDYPALQRRRRPRSAPRSSASPSATSPTTCSSRCQLELAGRADLLAQPAEQRQLHRGGADAAAADRLGRRCWARR